MAVLFAPEGTRTGGLTRTDDDSVTYAIACRGNSDASGLVLQLAYDRSFGVLVPGTYTDGSATSSTNYHNLAVFKGRIEPNQRIYWRSRLNGVGGPINGSDALNSGSFLAPPRKDRPRTWQIAVMGCTHLNRTGSRSRNFYRGECMRRTAALGPDGVIHVGDISYFDSGGDNNQETAPFTVGDWFAVSADNAVVEASINRYRTNWITSMVHTAHLGSDYSLAHLCAERPLWVIRDDHCLSSATNPTMPETSAGSWQEAARSNGFPALHEYMLGLNKPLVEQTHVYSKNYLAPADHHRFDMWPVRFLMLAARDYHKFGKTDNASKTLVDVLGTDQDTWLRSEISAFAATGIKDMPFLCVVSSIDWDSNHGWVIGGLSSDNWQQSSYPRQELFDMIWDSGIGNRTFTVTGDAHSTSVAYYQKTKAHPRLWGFMCSNAVGIAGHEQNTGWGGRLLGFDQSGAVGWGGVPVVNLSGIRGWNNALQITAGVDGKGPYVRCKVWYIWPNEFEENIRPMVPGFCKEFRARSG